MLLENALQKFADECAETKGASFTITYLKDASWQINFNNQGYPSKKFKALDPKTAVAEAHTWLLHNRKKIPPVHKNYTL